MRLLRRKKAAAASDASSAAQGVTDQAALAATQSQRGSAPATDAPKGARQVWRGNKWGPKPNNRGDNGKDE